MDKLDDSIATAERQVVESKAVMQAEFSAIEAKVRRAASSPMLLGGVLIVALTTGYLAIGARNKQNTARPWKAQGTWSRLLQIGQLLVPLLGTVLAAQKARRKAISPAIVRSEEESQD